MALPENVKQWHWPLSYQDTNLGDAYQNMQKIALKQESIPWVVQLVENPDYDIPGITIFDGATNLETHDLIHILLGRGVLPKDEAFVIGFTMGSSNRVGSFQERLYSLFTRYFYPRHYQFGDEDLQVYKDAIRLGYISDCQPLDKVDYASLLNLTIKEARTTIGIEENLLSAYYEIEAARYPHSIESQRNISD